MGGNDYNIAYYCIGGGVCANDNDEKGKDNQMLPPVVGKRPA